MVVLIRAEFIWHIEALVEAILAGLGTFFLLVSALIWLVRTNDLCIATTKTRTRSTCEFRISATGGNTTVPTNGGVALSGELIDDLGEGGVLWWGGAAMAVGACWSSQTAPHPLLCSPEIFGWTCACLFAVLYVVSYVRFRLVCLGMHVDRFNTKRSSSPTAAPKSIATTSRRPQAMLVAPTTCRLVSYNNGRPIAIKHARARGAAKHSCWWGVSGWLSIPQTGGERRGNSAWAAGTEASSPVPPMRRPDVPEAPRGRDTKRRGQAHPGGDASGEASTCVRCNPLQKVTVGKVYTTTPPQPLLPLQALCTVL